MHDVAKGISNVPTQSNARPRRRGRAVAISIGLLIAIFVSVFGIKALQVGKMMSTKMEMPPTTVSSATVKEEDWAPTLSAVGSISAVQGAVVSSELGGVVSQIAFENGGTAKKGDLLLQLDASAEEALLRSAEAEAELGRQDLERSRGLASQKVVSKAELDAAESKFNRLNAVADQMRSNIRKKTIIAPFDGQLGITSGAAHFTRLTLRRFRLAPTISWSVNAGLGGARDHGRSSRPCISRKGDRN